MKQCIKGNHLKYGDPFVEKAPEGVVLCMDCVDKHDDKQVYNIFEGMGRRVGTYQVGYQPGLYATLKADPENLNKIINTMLEQSMSISNSRLSLAPPINQKMIKVQLTQEQRDMICAQIYASDMSDRSIGPGLLFRRNGHDCIILLQHDIDEETEYDIRFTEDNTIRRELHSWLNVDETKIIGQDIFIGQAIDRYEKKFATLDSSYNFTDGLYVLITDRKDKLSSIPTSNATPERDTILAHIKTLLDKIKT